MIDPCADNTGRFWNTRGTLTSLNLAFGGAVSFNQPLDTWDVSNVTQPDGFTQPFYVACAFNQNLSAWARPNEAGACGLLKSNNLLAQEQLPAACQAIVNLGGPSYTWEECLGWYAL
eukprot:g78063.t1